MKTWSSSLFILFASIVVSACGSGAGVGSQSGSGPAPVSAPSSNPQPTILGQMSAQNLIEINQCFQSSRHEESILASATLMNCLNTDLDLKAADVDAHFDRSFIFLFKILSSRQGAEMDLSSATILMKELAAFESL